MVTKSPTWICVDFDGTCVTHAYPEIGADIGAVPVLKDLVIAGHKLILFTMRSNGRTAPVTTHPLTEAVGWFMSHGIPLTGVNANPTQSAWTASPKAYGELYIDDAALGAPLKRDEKISPRPFIDWVQVRAYLETNGYLPAKH